MSKLLIVIPAYNEEANIVKVVNGIVKNYPQYDYVVVNDGSRDKTAAICREHGFRLIDLPVNLGLAGAFQTGLRYAAENGYDCAMQLDADGQHRPEYIAAMLEGAGKRGRHRDWQPLFNGEKAQKPAHAGQLHHQLVHPADPPAVPSATPPAACGCSTAPWWKNLPKI